MQRLLQLSQGRIRLEGLSDRDTALLAELVAFQAAWEGQEEHPTGVGKK